MRGLAQWSCVAFLGLLATGCGDSGGGPPPECIEEVCPCTEGGVLAAIAEGGGPFTFECDGPTRVSTSREIVIDNDVTLDGEGNLTLDANQRHRVIAVTEGVTVELVGLFIVNGSRAEENGGGILNEGMLTLTNSTVSGSSAGRESGCRTDDPQLLCAEGGGIWNAGTLTLMNSTVSGNAAHFGGGIANRGSATLFDSSILSNSASGCRSSGAVVCSFGGGIWNSATMTMSNSIVSGSSADWGAGIFNRQTLTLTESIVSENSAGFDGGGFLNFETAQVFDSSFVDNAAGQSGGGAANPAPGVLDVIASTLSGNTAVAVGGGIYNPSGGTTDLVSSTLSGNTAETGGGIYNGGDISVVSCTFAENEAPTATALFDPGTSGAETRLIKNTLIEGDCSGSPFDSDGYNIESPGDTCGFDQETDRPAEAQLDLGPLEDNGGPTETHALMQGSIAIDRIPDAECTDGAAAPLSTDQRGEPRPGGPSSACDVGAFEAQP